MKEKSAFFVTPIGSEGSKERERSDRILEYVLHPILGDQFDIVRADKVTMIGSINHDIIERLYHSDLVIADLTGLNPNVMYELGIRHSFNRSVVQLAQSGQQLPFDLGSERTIFFDLSDIKDVESAKTTILATVAASQTETYEGPVRRTLGLNAIFQDNQITGRAMKNLASKIEDVEAAVYELSLGGIPVEMDFDQNMQDKLDHIYKIASAIRPYDIDMVISRLKEIASRGK